MKPVFFGESGMGTEPGFEILVGSLPILPTGRYGAHSATFGAEVVDIERF